MRVALLGTGLMGWPMAVRLLDAGYELTVYNRHAERAASLAERGARVADTPAQAVAAAEVVLLMLADAPAIRAVLLADAVYEQLANRTVIQMGTIAPGESRGLLAAVRDAGGSYLEAPVLGSIAEVEAGALMVMIGATPTQFEQYRALLGVFGPEPHLVGEVGQAAALKLALNQLIASLTAAFSLSLGIIEREGVNLELFLGILRRSALYAPTFEKKLPRMLARDYANPNFSTRMLAKDVDLVLDEARALGLEDAALVGVRQVIAKALERGFVETDYSALSEAVRG